MQKENKILLVEDSMTQAVNYKNFLKKNGFTVELKNSAAAGIEYLKSVVHKDFPDLIITDLYMPEINGYEFCEKIKKEIEPNAYVLFLTVESDEKAVAKAFESGAVDFIRKPFVELEFLVRIKNLITLKRKNDFYIKSLEQLMQSNERIKEYSQKDILTSTYNRPVLINSLIDKIYDLERYNTKFSMIMFGIDRMKDINYNYGQSFGDQILRKAAMEIFKIIRRTDVFGRYDGDIFVLLLPNINLENAVAVAEKINIQFSKIKEFNDSDFAVSISCSVLEYCKSFKDYRDFLEKASEMLTEAKKSGPGTLKQFHS